MKIFNMDRKPLLIYLLLLALLPVYGQTSFSLEEAVRYGQQSNAAVRKARLDIAEAEGQLLEYKSTGIPKVNAAVDYNYYPQVPQFLIPRQFIDPDAPEGSFALLPAGTEQGVIARVDASAMVFDAAWLVGLKAQRLYRELTVRQASLADYEVKAQVTKAYLAVLIARKNAEVLERNVSNLEKTLVETRTIYENGFAEKLDVDRLRLSLANLRVELDKVRRMESVSLNLLKFQMGYPLSDDIELTDELEPLVDGILVEGIPDESGPIHFAARPEFRVLNIAEELAGINIRRYKAGYLPTLSAFGSHQQQLLRNELFNSDENGWFGTTVVGLSLNLPIFDGLDKKAKLERAQVTRDKTLIDKQEFQRSMTLEVRNARANLHNASESLEATRASLDLALEIYETTRIKFREGVGSSVEVSQAERELYTAQANYSNALYELAIARTDLDKAIGKL